MERGGSDELLNDGAPGHLLTVFDDRVEVPAGHVGEMCLAYEARIAELEAELSDQPLRGLVAWVRRWWPRRASRSCT